MKTITLTDEQFDTLFEYVDNKVEFIGTRNLLGSKDNFFNVKEEHISQAILIC